MWRSHLTASRATGWSRFRSAERRVRLLSGLLLASAMTPFGIPGAHAFQVTPPDAATQAAMQKRTAARTLLSSALGRIATNSTDTAALLDAGRASIELEDYRAALGFLARAEQAAPRDATVKAAMGSVMVRMENPSRALDYFGEAQLLGASERLVLADRGLARDLLGQQDAAQRDYQMALSIAPNDETLRRYALSLGISGETDRAVQLLVPQLRTQNRGAWRMRAMILAMSGRNDEATEIVNATMPPALAQGILPYLTQMNRLNPAQQAAAAHFGRFPNGQLGPPRAPTRVAVATPAPTPPAASGRRRPNSERARVAGTLTPTPTPPAPVTARRVPEPVVKPTSTSAATPPPKPAPVPAPSPAPTPSAATQIASAVRTTPPPADNPVPTAVVASEAMATRPPAGMQSAVPTPAQETVAATTTLPPANQPGAVTTAPIGVVVDREAGPVGPGFSIADFGRSTTASGEPAGANAPSGGVIAAATTSPNAAPLASLADIIGSIEIPPEELARQSGALDAAALAKLQDDKRREEVAEAAKREKDAAAARAKADAEAKAKAAADEKKANPARAWVQIATGADARALAFDFRRMAKKYPDSFKGQSGHTAEWNRTRRLLVGPFKDGKAASAWLAAYEKAGGDGFTFNSDAGQAVDPLK